MVTGIPIRHCFDWKLFNLRRLHAKSTVQIEVLDEFFFADKKVNIEIMFCGKLCTEVLDQNVTYIFAVLMCKRALIGFD